MPDGVTVIFTAPFCGLQDVTGLVVPLIVILEVPLAIVTLPVPVQPPAAVTVTE